MRRFEFLFRPPSHALPKQLRRVGEELVAISFQSFQIDRGGPGRPIAPVAGFVAQIGAPTRRRTFFVLPPKADIGSQSDNVRFVPKADIQAAVSLPPGPANASTAAAA
jgi:hypothetical protein